MRNSGQGSYPGHLWETGPPYLNRSGNTSNRTGAAKATLDLKPVDIVEQSQLVIVEALPQVAPSTVSEPAADVSTKEAFSDTLLTVEDIDTDELDISCQSSIQEVTMSDVTIDEEDDDQFSSDEDTDGDELQHDDSLCLEGPESLAVTPSACDDAEVTGAQQDEARVDVVFPGSVTLYGCCHFVTEILKCVLYQRQQLPMPYEQLKTWQDSMQNEEEEEESWRPVQSADMGWRRRERNLQELDVLLEQLEDLFSLSLVPRVVLLLGGSLVQPKEMYDIRMDALRMSSLNLSLPVPHCLKQICRTLIVSDVLSDTAPVRLTSTRVLVLAHRECGVDWFRPQLNFKVPTRGRSQGIELSSDTACCRGIQPETPDWTEYVWFQAPTAIKGFR